MTWAHKQLQGWGRNKIGAGEVARPERMASLTAALHERGTKIAYGAGRSYGDCALNAGGRMIMTSRLDRVLAFDRDSGLISVEPGVAFDRLWRHFLPRGFLPPVTPGTGFATIGGAVANDVHGKNHEHMGSFGRHVQAIELILANGETRLITADTDPALFWATIGGIGLTGFITKIMFRLMRVDGSDVHVKTRRAKNLDDFLSLFDQTASSAYSVGWIDACARGASLGRGILETAQPAGTSSAPAPNRQRRVPFDFPGFTLNRLSVGLFNEVYFRRVPAHGHDQLVHYAQFLYPLDAIREWNRIYGKRGFHQFQCAVPLEQGPQAVRRLMERVARSGSGSFLAVLKKLGAEGGGMLSFPMPGYTLALDFPHKTGVETLYHELVKITRDAGGRVYLGKDALLNAQEFQGMYPRLPEFCDVLAEFNPERAFSSNMARRLGLA